MLWFGAHDIPDPILVKSLAPFERALNNWAPLIVDESCSMLSYQHLNKDDFRPEKNSPSIIWSRIQIRSFSYHREKWFHSTQFFFGPHRSRPKISPPDLQPRHHGLQSRLRRADVRHHHRGGRQQLGGQNSRPLFGVQKKRGGFWKKLGEKWLSCWRWNVFFIVFFYILWVKFDFLLTYCFVEWVSSRLVCLGCCVDSPIKITTLGLVVFLGCLKQIPDWTCYVFNATWSVQICPWFTPWMEDLHCRVVGAWKSTVHGSINCYGSRIHVLLLPCKLVKKFEPYLRSCWVSWWCLI